MTGTHSSPPRPPAERDGSSGACPPSETLSAYIEGKLTGADRERLEDHLSRCEDCYFVVKEVGLAAPAVSRPFALGRWLPVAAAVVLAAAPILYWYGKPQRELSGYPQAVAPLVKAVGERRFVEARLSGGFPFGPVVRRTRSAESSAERDWAVAAAAARVREAAEASPTVEKQRALAAAHLLMDETDLAVDLLQRLAGEHPADAGLQSDLAAAYLTRAQHDRAADDYARALEAAARAVELDALLAEGWFNKALAARALNLAQEAADAERRLRELEGDSGWVRSLEDAPSSRGEREVPHR